MSDDRHVAIIGAGPIGLEAALAAAEAGYGFTIYEAAERAGAHVRSWGHVRLFTPWDLNASARARRVLAAAGTQVPDGTECPTGDELADQLIEPILRLPRLAPAIEFGTTVVEVGRDGLLKSDRIGSRTRADVPFRLLVRGPDRVERVERADIVLDCSGTYGVPNALGVGGIHAPGENDASDHIVRRIPKLDAGDPDGGAGWAGRRVLLVGAGHSAQTAARDLASLVERAPDTRVTWAIRSESPDFGAVEGDPLPQRAALTASSRALVDAPGSPIDVRLGTMVDSLGTSAEGVTVVLKGADGERTSITVDRIVSLTGFIGDARMYRQLQVHECWATSGPMKLAAALLSSSSAECLTESSHGPDTLRNPEPNFFILGEKSYGRNNKFLMRVGWEQVADVFSILAAESPVPTP